MAHEPRILVVDDDAVVRASCRRVLESAGHAVDTAGDAAAALRLLAARPYALALVDLRMPGPSGLTLIGALRGLHPDTEVIVITGYATVDNAKESILLGAFDYLLKPLDPEAVRSAVRRTLECRDWRLHKELLP